MPELKHFIRHVSIYNITPPSLTTLGTSKDTQIAQPVQCKQYKLFEGTMVILEKMVMTSSTNRENEDDNNDDYSMKLPKTAISIEFRHKDSQILFCKTANIDNIAKFDETIISTYSKKQDLLKYKIIMEANDTFKFKKRIPLEVTIHDKKDQLVIHDLFVRIRDEFELIDDMYYM